MDEQGEGKCQDERLDDRDGPGSAEGDEREDQQAVEGGRMRAIVGSRAVSS
jgi:hypothetical protein